MISGLGINVSQNRRSYTKSMWSLFDTWYDRRIHEDIQEMPQAVRNIYISTDVRQSEFRTAKCLCLKIASKGQWHQSIRHSNGNMQVSRDLHCRKKLYNDVHCLSIAPRSHLSSNWLLPSQCLPMHRLLPPPSNPPLDSPTSKSLHNSFISTGMSSLSSYSPCMINLNESLRMLTSSHRRSGTP